MHKVLPQEIFEIRCSEIVSVVILGQKQSRSSYMARGYIHPIFGFPCLHLLAKTVDIEFPREGTKFG